MNPFTTIDFFYLACAVIGAVMFIVRAVMGAFAGDAGDFDGDVGAHDLAGDAALHDPGVGQPFHWFSLQGLTGFFIMFGLVGLALSRAGWPVMGSALAGLLAGGGTMLVVAYLLYSMQRLQADGNLRIMNAVGKEGTVYLTISEAGQGQVSLVVQGSLRQFDAVCAAGVVIPTGAKVRVVRVVSARVLEVERIE